MNLTDELTELTERPVADEQVDRLIAGGLRQGRRDLRGRRLAAGFTGAASLAAVAVLVSQFAGAGAPTVPAAPPPRTVTGVLTSLLPAGTTVRQVSESPSTATYLLTRNGKQEFVIAQVSIVRAGGVLRCPTKPATGVTCRITDTPTGTLAYDGRQAASEWQYNSVFQRMDSLQVDFTQQSDTGTTASAPLLSEAESAAIATSDAWTALRGDAQKAGKTTPAATRTAPSVTPVSQAKTDILAKLLSGKGTLDTASGSELPYRFTRGSASESLSITFAVGSTPAISCSQVTKPGLTCSTKTQYGVVTTTIRDPKGVMQVESMYQRPDGSWIQLLQARDGSESSVPLLNATEAAALLTAPAWDKLSATQR